MASSLCPVCFYIYEKPIESYSSGFSSDSSLQRDLPEGKQCIPSFEDRDYYIPLKYEVKFSTLTMLTCENTIVSDKTYSVVEQMGCGEGKAGESRFFFWPTLEIFAYRAVR